MANLALMFLQNTKKLPENIRFCPEEAVKLIQRVQLITFRIICTGLLRNYLPVRNAANLLYILSGNKSYGQIPFIDLNWCI